MNSTRQHRWQRSVLYGCAMYYNVSFQGICLQTACFFWSAVMQRKYNTCICPYKTCIRPYKTRIRPACGFTRKYTVSGRLYCNSQFSILHSQLIKNMQSKNSTQGEKRYEYIVFMSKNILWVMSFHGSYWAWMRIQFFLPAHITTHKYNGKLG